MGTVLAGTVWYVGLEMERSEYDRMSRFRDKSALYAGTKPAGDTEPSWGRPSKNWKRSILTVEWNLHKGCFCNWPFIKRAKCRKVGQYLIILVVELKKHPRCCTYFGPNLTTCTFRPQTLVVDP